MMQGRSFQVLPPQVTLKVSAVEMQVGRSDLVALQTRLLPEADPSALAPLTQACRRMPGRRASTARAGERRTSGFPPPLTLVLGPGRSIPAQVVYWWEIAVAQLWSWAATPLHWWKTAPLVQPVGTMRPPPESRQPRVEPRRGRRPVQRLQGWLPKPLAERDAW